MQRELLLLQAENSELDRRKSVECFHNGFVGYFQSFLDGFSFYQLGCHTAGCNCGAAAEGFEFAVLNDAVIVDVKIHSHDIAAFCISNGTYTACVLNFSYISRMLEMIHYFFTVHCYSSS